uniref:ribulose-bisphosphate carboxylase n=1 Tax=Chromera velia CCMP2878 TaxID=1169474 RepID=A0A0G4GM17_9ALVE|eukprot:Cvel_22467.t1-p1 / transcript=Cvel_22467.t1 / gene=Cvel_22467 / organism=Chromera_velia_CCMP2878 / gene_product=Ribulose bisphosphate carboxylase, putative / transcript_product=Ribulose bisphosphate carboxylase, putative / location=Cvel_scaffold2210:26868-29066(+) / protein_length=550 / sequence_SO=supercontig / SO=protein_coding / is_pseudo=false
MFTDKQLRAVLFIGLLAIARAHDMGFQNVAFSRGTLLRNGRKAVQSLDSGVQSNCVRICGERCVRMGLDQSNRYAKLDLDEETLIKEQQHVLVAYKMRPKYPIAVDYVSTAAHFAAESSTGTNVNVCTTDDHTMSVDAVVYEVDEDEELMKIAYPVKLFDRNITDGRAMVCSILTLVIGNNQGMGDVEYGKIHDIFIPPNFLRLFDGPAVDIRHMWRVLGRETDDYDPIVGKTEWNGGFVVGTIIKPKLGLRPKEFAEAAYQFWLGGDFLKNDEPQGNQTFCPMRTVIPMVVEAMKRAMAETGRRVFFSANITADDPDEMIARGKYVLGQFDHLAEQVSLLVDGYVAGPTAVTTSRRNFPRQYLHYHRAGHGAVTSPQTQRGYTALVLSKISRMLGASGIHVGTMGYGKMESEKSDKDIVYMLERDIAQGPYYKQDWAGMLPTTGIISGGMNAVRMVGFFENLTHANVIMTCGGGSYGHVDGPAEGATSCRQAWLCWKAGEDPIEYAKKHRQYARAFISFPGDADKLFPNWRTELKGLHDITGEEGKVVA